ncbi:MAG: XcyI family restriction endonuclease [Nitrososphaera sp.]
MPQSNQYTERLRLVKSLLIVTSLQKRSDLNAVQLIRAFTGELKWKPLNKLLIDPQVWDYAVQTRHYDPKLVFCHPDILLSAPPTSLYYRCLSGLSLKAVRDYFGSVESLEAGTSRGRLNAEKALKMARTYNTYVCSIIRNSTDWTLENGYRTIVATLGITLDGVMRNKVGAIAEERIRTLILEWLIERRLLVAPTLTKDKIYEKTRGVYTLKGNVTMQFGSEPDISFKRGGVLLAVIEIKGGIDPAGALERYGAATKSFQHAVRESPRCKNFYFGAVYTSELNKRISNDRLVEKTFNIIEVLDKPEARSRFFQELFHHTLRVI